MYFQIISEIQKTYDKTVSLLTENEISICPCISTQNQELIHKIFQKKKFTAKEGEVCEVSFLEGELLCTTIFVGLGKKEQLRKDILRESLYSVLKEETGHFLLSVEDSSLMDLDVFAEMAEHINYDFDKYKSKKKDKFLYLDFYCPHPVDFPKESASLSEISSLVRNLINEPAAYMTPERLSIEAQICSEKYGFEIEILDEHKADSLGMKAFLAVGRAAVNRPKVIVMRYRGNPNSKEMTALIGKGVCYDTGGLSLKPTSGMLNMKDDMSGAATVIGILSAVAENKIKHNVVGVIAACENAIGPNSYRPGDVIGSLNGKTIEVTNTDAEGRLTLADALTYSLRVEKATELIDIATLTGAMYMALGSEACGVITNTPSLYQDLVKASEAWREEFWQMPLFTHQKKALTSSVADIKNSGPRIAGASFAATFLEEFVENTPWLHLDVAGTCFSEDGDSYYKKGATGQLVRSVYSYLKNKEL
ncbi:leucyl aminopeptidase [Fusobacterium necrophorum]|uniref:leucyl aminopeptidase n=1 Tax=Fusobacterium necrophorum TaxID=859 RepID=UPI003F9FEEAF